MKNINFKKEFFYAFYISLTVCVLSPLLTISSNRSDFFISNIEAFFINITFTWILFFLAAFIILCAVLRAGVIFEKIIFSIFVTISIWAFYAPLMSGQLDGLSVLKPSYVNLGTGILFGIVAFIFFVQRKIILIVLLTGPLLLSIHSMFNLVKTEYISVPIPVSETEQNIFVISFDELQTEFIKRVLRDDNQLRKKFDGFILFDDVIGVGPATRLSTAITKLGHLPETDKYDAAFKKSITNKLSQNGFKIETMHEFSQRENRATKKLSPQMSLWDIEYFVALKCSLCKILPYDPSYVSIIHYWLSILRNNKNDALIGMDKNPLTYFKRQPKVFDSFVKNLKLGNDNNGTLRMHHYYFTHNPFRLKSDCEFTTESGLTGPLEETRCAFTKMVLLIERLKKLGVYESSTIFFVSDHGYECNHAYKGNLELQNYRLNKRWCLSRYMPFLMVKKPYTTGTITYSKTPVSLLDISKTICIQALGANGECDIYTGYNLFSAKAPLNSHTRPILVAEIIKYLKNYKFDKDDIVHIGRYRTLEQFVNGRNRVVKKIGRELHGGTNRLVTEKGTVVTSSDKPGYLTFGPYILLNPGTYKFGIRYKFYDGMQNNSRSYWDVVASLGKIKLHKNHFANSKNRFIWDEHIIHIDRPLKKVELRSFFDGSGKLEVESIRIEELPTTAFCKRKIKFNNQDDLKYYKTRQIDLIEPWGKWSHGPTSKISFNVEEKCKFQTLKFNLKAFVTPKDPERIANVFINDQFVSQIKITLDETQPKEFTFTLPNVRTNSYTVRFEINNSAPPKSVGSKEDKRKLGFGFISMELLPASTAQ